MAARQDRLPRLRWHQASGQYRVDLSGKSHYLGKDQQRAQTRYDCLTAQWLANGRRPEPERPPQATYPPVAEILLRYLDFARTYYRRQDGSPTREVEALRHALQPLLDLFGDLPVTEFGPRKLKRLREMWIQRGHSRKYINGQVGRIKRTFQWACSEELAPPAIFEGLRTVDGLRRGRSLARETDPVRAVPWEDVSPRPKICHRKWFKQAVS